MLGPGKDTNGFPQFPNVPLTVLVEGFLSRGPIAERSKSSDLDCGRGPGFKSRRG